MTIRNSLRQLSEKLLVAALLMICCIAFGSLHADADTAGVDMYRLYNPFSGEHFYTANYDEMQFLYRQGWVPEGVGWIAPFKSEQPVYRLYNPVAGDHHYTMDEGEKKWLIRVGWQDEGIGWYSAGPDAVPLMRAYNPYAETGTHNYTTNTDEHRYLSKIGWHDEGIAWYAVGMGYDKPYSNPMSNFIGIYMDYGNRIAEDDRHGYSQSSRWGPDYDCSSFVIECLRYAGIDTANAVYTGNMKEELLGCGFIYIDTTSLTKEQVLGLLQYGDILLSHTDEFQHAAFYVGDNYVLDATPIDGDEETGDQSGREICQRYSWMTYEGFLRYVG